MTFCLTPVENEEVVISIGRKGDTGVHGSFLPWGLQRSHEVLHSLPLRAYSLASDRPKLERWPIVHDFVQVISLQSLKGLSDNIGIAVSTW